MPRVFGNAYAGETVTHAGRTFRPTSSGTRVERDTWTITPWDLEFTTDDEAVMGVGLLHADADRRVEDRFYEATLARDAAGMWPADLTEEGLIPWTPSP